MNDECMKLHTKRETGWSAEITQHLNIRVGLMWWAPAAFSWTANLLLDHQAPAVQLVLAGVIGRVSEPDQNLPADKMRREVNFTGKQLKTHNIKAKQRGNNSNLKKFKKDPGRLALLQY